MLQELRAQAQPRFEEAMRRGVTEITAEVSGRAIKDAPVDEGTLRASGSYFVDGKFIAEGPPDSKGRRPANRSGGVEVAQIAGKLRGVVGFNVPYAAVQHEETGYRHPRGGKAKYLQGALRDVSARVPEVLRRIAKRAGF